MPPLSKKTAPRGPQDYSAATAMASLSRNIM